MFSQELKEKYPFLIKYFEKGLKKPKRELAHSILFYGNDIEAQYALATDLARILNCKELKNKDCKCINCNWIRDEKHPAVLTVSKFDNKPSDDDSKTVISVKQAQMIKNSLLNTSEFHRVFIFCDAKMEGEKRIPLGLNEQNFQEETANALLKTIEEPPSNTTFFFLTRDKNDLIETIISRSQSFFVPSFEKPEKDFSAVSDIFENYPNIERKESLDLAQSLFMLSKDIDSLNILKKIQNYMLALMKANIKNSALKTKILEDIKTVETAKKQINAKVNPQLAFENMCLNLTKPC
ncbi:MAG TPA: hypothetical protein PLG15_03005 [Candidatus Gastranaerophilaceae bacterium]|nr:hypothetical protein [Candidatus Gastranaerophilaceae bacterium]